MRSSRRNTLTLPHLGLVSALTLILTACGGSQSEATPEPDQAAAPASAPEAQADQSASDEATPGSVTVMIDGAKKSFGYLPESENTYVRLASTIRAYTETGSIEQFSINFMSIDLKELTYPTELPLPKDLSKPMDAMSAMASVGFGYVNADGMEWAGLGKIQVESFDRDGTLRGTFDQISLPHTDSEQPNIVLTGGAFSAKITSPW